MERAGDELGWGAATGQIDLNGLEELSVELEGLDEEISTEVQEALEEAMEELERELDDARRDAERRRGGF